MRSGDYIEGLNPPPVERTATTSCSRAELDAAINDAVRAALKDPGKANWTDGRIARSSGASVELVAEIRCGPAVLSPGGATIAEAARQMNVSLPMAHLAAAILRGDGDVEHLLADFEAGRLDLSKAASSRFVLAEGADPNDECAPLRHTLAPPEMARTGPLPVTAPAWWAPAEAWAEFEAKIAALPPSSPIAVWGLEQIARWREHGSPGAEVTWA